MNFQRTTGLFSSILWTKLFCVVFLALSCLGTKGVKEEKITWPKIWTVLFSGFVFFFLNWWLLVLPIGKIGAASLYIFTLSVGYICLLMGGVWMSRLLKNNLMDDVFNTENEISFKIRGAIFKVYDELGPGLLESIYEAALCYQMKKDGLKVENQTKLDVYYDNHLLPLDYRLDILVEDKVIIELKSVDEVTPVHFKQLLTYLKLANKRLGILVNFNADNISKAIYRKVNNL